MTIGKTWERILLVAGGFGISGSGTVTDLVGTGILLLIYFIQKARKSKAAAA